MTALYDIGRGDWHNYQRSFHSYIHYFTSVLKLNTPLVVYCERSTADHLKIKYRSLLHSNVHIVTKPFREIEYEKHRQVVQEIMKSKQFRKDNHMLNNPEGFSVDYILLMNNKLSFIKDSIRINKFNSTHYFWIDAGYGHGDSDVLPADEEWSPTKLMTMNTTVTFTVLNDPNLHKDIILKLHKKNVDPVISGGFFGGHKKAVLEFYHLYNKVFNSMVLENIVDDDQNIALMCYYELPRLFNLVPGDWFDAFKLYG